MSDKAGSSRRIRGPLIVLSLVSCLSWTGCGSSAPEADAKGSQPQAQAAARPAEATKPASNPSAPKGKPKVDTESRRDLYKKKAQQG